MNPKADHDEAPEEQFHKDAYETPEIVKSEGLIDITSQTLSPPPPSPTPKDR